MEASPDVELLDLLNRFSNSINQIDSTVVDLDALVLKINDKLQQLEKNMVSLSYPIQSSVYDYVVNHPNSSSIVETNAPSFS